MPKKIIFLLGSANLSGGTYVIFQHASYLQSIGYSVTIALVFMTTDEFVKLKNSDKCWHEAIHQLNFISIHEAKQIHYDIAIFTWWATLFSFEKITADKYIYFVQSIESRFYREDETFMRDLVNRTYKLGLPVVTEATWIKTHLTQHYAAQCALARNGILKTIYRSDGDVYAAKPANGIRILVEGPLDAPYKNVTRTIELCQKANVGEIWLLTSSDVKEYPGVNKIFSKVSIYDVPKIYRSCDVLVKLSFVEGMFGPPLEMFHCGGTAIVYDVTGYDEYIIHYVNALVAKMHDESAVINYLQQLQKDNALLQRLKEGAQATAQQWIDWKTSSSDFVKVIESLPMSNKSLIKNSIQTYLREYIWVKSSLNEELMPAIPLYDSGYYALTIPIAKNQTQFEILMGKNYRQVRVVAARIIKLNKQTSEVQVENENSILHLAVQQMINLGQGIWDCLSEMSGIVATVNLNTLNFQQFHYGIQVEFNPIQNK